MLTPGKTTKFSRDETKARKQKMDFEALIVVMSSLIQEIPSDPKYKDHPLA